MPEKGKLYICPTPIGNLQDITLRVLRVLREVDIVAAENVKRTLHILNHYGIKVPLISYHQHNRKSRGEYLQRMLLKGKKIALVSDAGTPGISDPGYELIKDSIALNIPVISLPGPTAIMTAIVASGLPADSFFFRGFLPKTRGKRKTSLTGLKNQQGTLIFYASPHGLTGLLKDAEEALGNRSAVIARELSKKYEEYIRGTLRELSDRAEKEGIKGECVLMIEGASGNDDRRAMPWEGMDIGEHLRWNIKGGLSKKEAIALTAKQRGIPKRLVYAESIEKK